MLNVSDVPTIPISENIPRLLRHVREDSVERVVDREHPHGVVFGYGQDDEPIVQLDVIPLQPKIYRVYPLENLSFKRN